MLIFHNAIIHGYGSGPGRAASSPTRRTPQDSYSEEYLGKETPKRVRSGSSEAGVDDGNRDI